MSRISIHNNMPGQQLFKGIVENIYLEIVPYYATYNSPFNHL